MTSTVQLIRQASREDLRRAFPGYGAAFLPSLVLAVSEFARDGLCGDAVEGRARTRDAPASWKGQVNPVMWLFQAITGAGGRTREKKDGASDETASGGAFESGAEERGSGHPLDEEGLYGECARRLLWITTPEAMCRFTGRRGKVGGRWREAMGCDLEQAAGKHVGLTSCIHVQFM